MRRSDLFEFIVSNVTNQSDASKRKNVSINVFFGEVLKCLAKGITTSDANVKAELARTQTVVSKHTTGYEVAYTTLTNYLQNNRAGFLDSYLFAKIMTEFEMNEGANFVVTVDAVCAKILAEPTAAIQTALQAGGFPSVAGEETNGSGKKGGGYTLSDEELDDLLDSLGANGGKKGGNNTPDTPIPPKPPVENPIDNGNGGNGKMFGEIVAKIDRARELLSETVFGQDHAISAFVSGYFQAELSAATQKHRDKPKATFLFAGPPGTGKTFLSEQVAKALGLPFMRFDMSEYADKESNIEFAGSDKVYKNGAEGNVTGFVAKNKDCVLLFDEIEKAHLNVIHLFLQILDAGRLRDNFTDEEVDFTNAIIIFTTNAGKQMYEDESINLLSVSRKSILKALSTDTNPVNGQPLFPAAICSRFAFGNVIMFNRMSANHLMQISEGEMNKQIKAISKKSSVKITLNEYIPYAVIFAEGGKADARTIKGKSTSFVYQELYELFRLINSENNNYTVDNLRSIKFDLLMPTDPQVAKLFDSSDKPNVLVFADTQVGNKCSSLIKCANVFVADSIESASEILDKNDISIILCDIKCKPLSSGQSVLNVEDADSVGRNFYYHITQRSSTPVYILSYDPKDISKEEFFSLSKSGASGMLVMSGDKTSLDAQVDKETNKVFQHKNLFELARANKVVTYKTLQQVSDDGAEAKIVLFDFKLVTAVDAEDSHGMLDGISKPNVKFSDVIGAKDAKDELIYFMQYLKNPAKFLRQGVKAPKGVLLYGPPGTGKTLLAKALASESDVTFIHAEGNQFLKKYVGEGPQMVHDLFKTARKYAPSILFIDEIDAIAKVRGNEFGTDTSAVLTSFLTEMDGFNVDKDRPVFVLAATNYEVEQGTSRSLDPALLRRFDRRIYVDLPNKEERIQYINYKIAKIPNNTLTPEQIDNLAVRSTGASLADLDSVFEMAIRDTIKSNSQMLTDAILEEAFEKYNSGDVKKWAPEELLRTARHEAGHALVCWYGGEKPTYLTIVARANHGGYMQHGGNEDKGSYTKKELLDRVRTSLAGRCAEMVYYGDQEGISTGASGDLRNATRTITNMICYYGMDEKLGMCSLEVDKLANSPYYMQVITRVNEILKEQLNITKQIISINKHAMDNLVNALMAENSLKEKEIDDILTKSGVKRIF